MSKRLLMRSAILCLALWAAPAGADDAQDMKAADMAIVALDAAFESQDKEAIRGLMTPDHVAITPYYDGPQTVAQQLASLDSYKLKQTLLSGPKVTLLAPGVALRTATAKFEGTANGKPVPERMVVTEIVVKQEGKWLEALYQLTPLEP